MTRVKGIVLGLLACAAVAFVLTGYGAHVAAESAGDPYALGTCPISGAELGEGAVTKEYDGREVKFCCGGCPGKFEDNMEESMAKLDEAMTKDQKAAYPLETCLISGEALDSMGGPVELVYNNRLVMFCCSMCEKGFKEDAAAKMAELDKAVIEAQSEDYPLDTCVVAGTDVTEGANEFVIANRLVKTCCGNCQKKVEANPAMYLSKIEEAG